MPQIADRLVAILASAKTELGFPEVRVMLTLALYANTNGEAWPTQATIAQRAKVRRDDWGTILRQFREKGLIQMVRPHSNREAARYLVTPDAETGAWGDRFPWRSSPPHPRRPARIGAPWLFLQRTLPMAWLPVTWRNVVGLLWWGGV